MSLVSSKYNSNDALKKNILVNVIDSEEKNDFRKKTFLVEIMLVVVNPLKIINVPKAVAATKHVKGNHEFLSTHPPMLRCVLGTVHAFVHQWL